MKHRTVSIVSVLPSTGESVLIVLALIFKMVLCLLLYFVSHTERQSHECFELIIQLKKF